MGMGFDSCPFAGGPAPPRPQPAARDLAREAHLQRELLRVRRTLASRWCCASASVELCARGAGRARCAPWRSPPRPCGFSRSNVLGSGLEVSMFALGGLCLPRGNAAGTLLREKLPASSRCASTASRGAVISRRADGSSSTGVSFAFQQRLCTHQTWLRQRRSRVPRLTVLGSLLRASRLACCVEAGQLYHSFSRQLFGQRLEPRTR